MAHNYHRSASDSQRHKTPPEMLPMRPIMRSEVPYCGVSGWPFTGGIWGKRLTAVEMGCLGIDRFNNVTQAADIVEEDTFILN